MDEEIQKALDELQWRIATRIRQEQLRDQLTGLANGAALMETVKDRLQKPGEFWVAFLEIDRFKSINDRFGYENADALLRKVAEMLRTMCSCFSGPTQAFRAHGDEFYMMGELGVLEEVYSMGEPGEPGSGGRPRHGSVHHTLDLVRESISAIKLPVDTAPVGAAALMSCQVSVGWLCISDIKETKTERRVLEYLERAVAEAKRPRNTVVRYSPEMLHQDSISLRADCAECGCKFSFDLPRAKNQRDRKVTCPNCGAETERPPEPQALPALQIETV